MCVFSFFGSGIPLTVSGLSCSRPDRQLRGADEARGCAAEPRRAAACEGRTEEEGNGVRERGARARPGAEAPLLPSCQRMTPTCGRNA